MTPPDFEIKANDLTDKMHRCDCSTCMEEMGKAIAQALRETWDARGKEFDEMLAALKLASGWIKKMHRFYDASEKPTGDCGGRCVDHSVAKQLDAAISRAEPYGESPKPID